MQNNQCKLTLLSKDDFDDMLAMFGEPDTFKYIPKLRDQTDEFYLHFLTSTVEKISAGDIYYWVMRAPENDEFMGAINLNKILNGDEMQIGWQICEDFRNQGLAYLGAQMALDFAIYKTEIEMIYGVFLEQNKASERILNKLRFSLETISLENEQLVHKYCFKISR
ncbi:MAG: hypothetical protein COB24_04395 [Hyphomicrobiales bacterium]|nr:MAG: hypothetical protein COB24_04395 [Hyphomicrobiales bacterium]